MKSACSFWQITSDDPSEPLSFGYTVEPQLVYVLGPERGKGYGLDLSVACSDVVCDIFAAVYESAPDGCTINTSIAVEYQSKGGQKFTEYLHQRLANAVESKERYGSREGIVLTGPELEGGW